MILHNRLAGWPAIVAAVQEVAKYVNTPENRAMLQRNLGNLADTIKKNKESIPTEVPETSNKTKWMIAGGIGIGVVGLILIARK